MKIIRKSRREHFGGIIYSEQPGLTAFINNDYADELGIPKSEHLPPNIYSAPLDVHISLTTKCNLFCKGCYSINASSPQKEMDFKLAKSIIINLSKLNVFTVSLGGGEPLLYDKVFELAKFIRDENIAPNLTTNGIIIDNFIAHKCKVFTNIHLSLHSMDDLDILNSAITNLRRGGIVPGLNLLITSETFPYLEDVFEWAAKNRLLKILLLQFKVTSKNNDFRYMQISEEQQINFFPIMKHLSKKHGIVPMIDCSLFPQVAIHSLKKKDLEFYDVNGCQGGNMYIAIDVDGYFKPCSFWHETFGEAVSLSFLEWQESIKLNQFRSTGSTETCKDCNYINLCNQGCRLFEKQICFGSKNAHRLTTALTAPLCSDPTHLLSRPLLKGLKMWVSKGHANR